MDTRNPLRYPGGKTKLVPYIQKLLITEGLKNCTFYEPYAGSAAVTFHLLKNNMIKKAIINELDPLIYCFWYSVMNYTQELTEKIISVDISVETWKEISKYRRSEYIKNKSILEIGFAGFFLNRTNYSGIIKANPIGGIDQGAKNKIDCRFNKEKLVSSIYELSSFKDRLQIYNMDAIEFLKLTTKYKRNTNIFVYIDPPYFEKGPTLYRYFYNNDMHKELAKYIKTKAFPWLISYDDNFQIKNLYKRKFQQQIYMDYSVNTNKKGKELLISNMEIPPLLQNVFCKTLVSEMV